VTDADPEARSLFDSDGSSIAATFAFTDGLMSEISSLFTSRLAFHNVLGTDGMKCVIDCRVLLQPAPAQTP
jgi:hypothetical protein